MNGLVYIHSEVTNLKENFAITIVVFTVLTWFRLYRCILPDSCAQDTSPLGFTRTWFILSWSGIGWSFL